MRHSLRIAALALVLAAASAAADVIDTDCAGCHASGAKGAPGIGDHEAWKERAAKGLPALTRNSIEGVRWGMPARGGVAELTPAELSTAIAEMLRRSGVSGETASHDREEGQGHTHHRVVAAGMIVHLTLIPARTLRAYPPGSAERALLGGASGESDLYHLSVTLEDGTTHGPVEGARVEAHVRQAGIGSQLVALDPCAQIAAATYGHFVHLAPGVPAIATLAIEARRSARASFELAIEPATVVIPAPE